MSLTLYGISNCDTVRKARRWLETNDVAYKFHDFRADGLESQTVRAWIDTLGWDQVINRRSTSWKALDLEQRETMDATAAEQAILSAPTLIKRPLLSGDGILELGFKAERYQELLT